MVEPYRDACLVPHPLIVSVTLLLRLQVVALSDMVYWVYIEKMPEPTRKILKVRCNTRIASHT